VGFAAGHEEVVYVFDGRRAETTAVVPVKGHLPCYLQLSATLNGMVSEYSLLASKG
jgi:hypothetical protein